MGRGTASLGARASRPQDGRGGGWLGIPGARASRPQDGRAHPSPLPFSPVIPAKAGIHSARTTQPPETWRASAGGTPALPGKPSPRVSAGGTPALPGKPSPRVSAGGDARAPGDASPPSEINYESRATNPLSLYGRGLGRARAARKRGCAGETPANPPASPDARASCSCPLPPIRRARGLSPPPLRGGRRPASR